MTTTTIKAFNKQNLPNIRKDLDAALSEVAKKYGITLGLGSMTFTPDSFTVKLSASTVNEGEVAGTKSAKEMQWEKDFTRFAFMLDLTPEDLGKTVVLGKETYVIAGARPRAKQNIVLKNTSSKGGFNAMESSIVKKFMTA